MGWLAFNHFGGRQTASRKTSLKHIWGCFLRFGFCHYYFFFATKWIKNHFCFNSMPWIFKQVLKKTTTTTTAWWPFDGLWSLLKIGVLWHLTINRFLEVALQFKLYKVTYFSCNLTLEPIFQVTLRNEICLIKKNILTIFKLKNFTAFFKFKS